MDRGVKIAIFVASIVSLGLGLVWDQVLSQARDAVDSEVAGEMEPERIEAVVGPPHVKRAPPTEEILPIVAPEPETEPEPEAPQPQPKGDWSDYVVKHGDSWWKIAHVHFKLRGLSSTDIAKANTGKKLRPGVTIKIPPGK